MRITSIKYSRNQICNNVCHSRENHVMRLELLTILCLLLEFGRDRESHRLQEIRQRWLEQDWY